VLIVSVPAEVAGDEEEQGLFREVAGDLALALHALASERERQAALQARQESESRFRTLVEHAPDAIFIQGGRALCLHESRGGGPVRSPRRGVPF
jgi:PAS domain-containing protein